MIVQYSTFALLLAVFVKLDVIVLFLNYSLIGGNDKTSLLVGILSAQSNARARNAIRETWGQLAINRSIEIKFLVGDEICPYPMEDRVTPYDCNLWLVNLPKASDEYSTVRGPANLYVNECITGFTFIVKTGILVRRLGLDSVVFSGSRTDRARVILYNSKTGKKVASATFLKESSSFGFVWKPVGNGVNLEAGFEGELKLESAADLRNSSCRSVLQYIAPVSYFESLSPSLGYTEYQLSHISPTSVAFNYSMKDSRSLEEVLLKRADRFEEWELTSTRIKQQLKEEQEKYGDMLFLSGFIDVYHNLDLKVATFFDWVQINDDWKYILKTDDDVFIDLSLVEEGLNTVWDVWTCFQNQLPNPWGKWRDRYSKAYPPFPSGSGYVLSREVVRDLSLVPRERLGEDVMMGIALPVGARRPDHSACCWACGARDPACSRPCNLPQLSPQQIRHLWLLYAKTGRIPSIRELEQNKL